MSREITEKKTRKAQQLYGQIYFFLTFLNISQLNLLKNQIDKTINKKLKELN